MPSTSAATAPPDDPPGVMRVSHGLRVTPVNGLSVTAFQPNSGKRGLADDDRALLAQPGHRRRILRRRRARREPRSKSGGHAGDEEIVLDADRDAIGHALGRARQPTRLGLARTLQGALGIHMAPGIHGAIVPIDAIEHGRITSTGESSLRR